MTLHDISQHTCHQRYITLTPIIDDIAGRQLLLIEWKSADTAKNAAAGFLAYTSLFQGEGLMQWNFFHNFHLLIEELYSKYT